jgi:hypothetical protein
MQHFSIAFKVFFPVVRLPYGKPIIHPQKGNTCIIKKHAPQQAHTLTGHRGTYSCAAPSVHR